MARTVIVYTVLMGFFTTAMAFAEPQPGPEAAFLLSFVVGDYALVGQGTDSAVAYTGRAW